jgi:hypothetical protein
VQGLTFLAVPPAPAPVWIAPLIRRLALACALFALSCIVIAAWTQDSTIDEPYHIDYPRRIIDDRLPARVGMFNSKTPALLPSVWVERLAIGAGVTSPRQLQGITRLTTSLYFIALLFAVFLLTRRFAGPQAAWVAVLCCSLEPNLIAHASLNTVDVAFALANLLALWAMMAFARRAGWRAALWLGAALGLAFTIKFTGLFLLPAVLSLAFWKTDGGWPSARERLRRAAWVLLALSLSMLVVSAAYYFRDFGKPLSQYAFVTAPFRLLSEWLGWLRLPLPEPFLLGIDRVAADERETPSVVIFDRLYTHGVWYYFAALWLFKTPIAIIAASIAAAWIGLRCGAFREPGVRLLFFQWTLYFAYFSFIFNFQQGYRFVLMLVPMACLFLAVGLRDWWARPRGAYLAVALAALSLAELVPYYGHALSFSNSFLLPKKDAFRVLADSNLYWDEYHAQLPALLAAEGARAAVNPFHILPGRNAFDGLQLTGLFWMHDRPKYFSRSQHEWARDKLQTSGHVRHAVFLYDVSATDFSRFLDESRRYPPAAVAASCAAAGHSSMRIDMPNTGWMLLCANASGLADVSFNVGSGTAVVGHLDDKGTCSEHRPMGRGQEGWLRLEPGHHVLCLTTDGGLAGSFEARRGTASFHPIGVR